MPSCRKSLKLPRIKAFKDQNGLCYYCKSPMWIDSVQAFADKYRVSSNATKLFQCTGEHLIPHSEGGSARADNIVTACLFCNKTRHKRKVIPSPEKYLADVRNRRKKGK